tara:strand:- start:164 stop:346 length:183 start_codon:yes stop_codon:yes gene_type:complete
MLAVENCNRSNIMKNQKKSKTTKPRNWLAVHAFQRSGAGKHKSKKTYTRKKKHKGAKYEN